MGNFLGFIEKVGNFAESVAPVIQTVTEFGNAFNGSNNNSPAASSSSAGDYAGGVPFYKQPWFIPVAAVAVLFLFGKKLMRLFK